MIRRTGVAVLAVATLLMTVTACLGPGDRGRGLQQRAVTIEAGTGALVVVAYPCQGQKVKDVSLWQMNKKGSDRERRLWGIAAASGSPSSVTRFVVGQTPEGFTEETPLVGGLPAKVELAAVVDMDGSLDVTFLAGEVRSDSLVVWPEWFNNRRHVSTQEFERVNAKECRPN